MQFAPRLDDDQPATLDDVASRIRRALLEIGSIAEIGGGADAYLLEAEQALWKVLRAIRAE